MVRRLWGSSVFPCLSFFFFLGGGVEGLVLLGALLFLWGGGGGNGGNGEGGGSWSPMPSIRAHPLAPQLADHHRSSRAQRLRGLAALVDEAILTA